MERRIATIGRHFAPSSQGDRSFTVKYYEKLGIRIEPGVQAALSEGRPVVALESTIISHGLTEKELEYLAQYGTKALKTARRDIAHVIAARATGATTVSATMFFAAKVGIHVFVTGGIGGVHRLGESTLDISSDLTELGRTPVVVVCAGVKSILDIPRTLEYLETQGVSVVAYGTKQFPAFFTSKSGCQAPCRADSPDECAAIAEVSLKLELQSGILIGVPIPEEYEADAEPVEVAIQEALQEIRALNIQGNAVTPYLLKRVNELTGGGSLSANIELIKNNAFVGSQISVSLQNLLLKQC